MTTSPGANQARPARVKPASHQRMQCIGDSWPPSGGTRVPFSGLSLYDTLIGVSGRALIEPEILTVPQHRPRQPGVLRRNGDHSFPVPAPLLQATRPAAEAILLLPQAGQNGAGTHDQETAQVTVAGLGDPPQSGFTPTAVLPRDEPDPRRNLTTVPEIVPVAETGQEGAGSDRADAGSLHQATAARIFARRLGDGFVVVGNAHIELVGVRQEVADALVGIAGQIFEMGADVLAQAGDFLRQDDAEFGDQAADSVIRGGTLFDEALSRAVQGEDDLLVFFLDRNKAHVGAGDGFADGRGIGGIVLAAFAGEAVGGDELRRHQFDGVAVAPEQPGPVVGAGAGFDADQARGHLHDQRQQLIPCDLRLDQYGFAVFIDAMHGKDVLGKIDSNSDNAHGLPLSSFVKWMT